MIDDINVGDLIWPYITKNKLRVYPISVYQMGYDGLYYTSVQPADTGCLDQLKFIGWCNPLRRNAPGLKVIINEFDPSYDGDEVEKTKYGWKLKDNQALEVIKKPMSGKSVIANIVEFIIRR